MQRKFRRWPHVLEVINMYIGRRKTHAGEIQEVASYPPGDKYREGRHMQERFRRWPHILQVINMEKEDTCEGDSGGGPISSW